MSTPAWASSALTNAQTQTYCEILVIHKMTRLDKGPDNREESQKAQFDDAYLFDMNTEAPPLKDQVALRPVNMASKPWILEFHDTQRLSSAHLQVTSSAESLDSSTELGLSASVHYKTKYKTSTTSIDYVSTLLFCGITTLRIPNNYSSPARFSGIAYRSCRVYFLLPLLWLLCFTEP